MKQKLDIKSWEKLRAQPIPFLNYQLDYANVSVNKADERCNEPIKDLKKYGIAGRNYYHSKWTPPYYHSIPGSTPFLLAREEVANKLSRVNERLKKMGLELYVLDALRPIAVQNYFYFDWMPAYLEKQNPGKGKEWAKKETEKYWAAGAKDITTLDKYPPPHASGGAVDLTLRVRRGAFLEMGTLFDDLCAASHVDYFEKVPPETFTGQEAMQNRRVLFHSMTAEDFVPHPFEWWHFSYGDRIWAATKEQSSFYGYQTCPDSQRPKNSARRNSIGGSCIPRD